MENKENRKNKLTQKIRWMAFSVLTGILAGLAAAVFLISLRWVTDYRENHEAIIWALPVIGFAIGWVYYQFGKDVSGGNNLILDEIHDPKKVIPFRMAPFILAGTVLTHLFGGSAGREGTAVQMGASLADQLSKFFKIDPVERKILLTAGAGAGFGAAIGAPWAGVIFGMEVINVGRLRLFALFECFIASFVGFYTTKFLGAPHTHYPSVVIPNFEWNLLVYVAVAGVLFGLSAQVFTRFTHVVEHTCQRWITYPPVRPLLAGVLLILLYWLEGSYQYDGLGLQYIQQALVQQGEWHVPLYKGFFTALTVGSGFKGGEFIPLVYIGSTLGSALAQILPVAAPFLAALGFAAVFGGASNTPIACSLMATEIFGLQIAPYALLACFMSYYFSGHSGIYRSQIIYARKHVRLIRRFRKE